MNMNEVKKEKLEKIFSICVLVSFVVPIIFLIFRIIVEPMEGTMFYETERTRSDYMLMLIQCLLGAFALVLPKFLIRKYNIKIPATMSILYLIFLYAAIFLGEVRNFYHVIPCWDVILHTFSGGMIGALGFSFVSLLNKIENLHLHLTPVFVTFFAFCFAITLGVVWEVYEYTFDGLLGLNMQKFLLESGEAIVGREALSDTMQDLIVDSIGAFVVCMIGYISLKYKKGWVEKLLIKKK